MDYKKKYKEALERARCLYSQHSIEWCDKDIVTIFPELAESEDEKIRKTLIDFFQDWHKNRSHCWGISVPEILAWLEKQGEQKPIMNVPSREVILSIWDLGNEWKELTNGSISTEYGTQLNYIQKHWHESEYYLREKQGEQKSQRMISAEAKEAMYGKTADKVEPKFKVKYAGSEYNVLDVKDIAGVTYYVIEDEPNNIDYVKANSCEIINVYSIKGNGSPYPTKPAIFAEHKSSDEAMKEALRTEYEKGRADAFAQMQKEWGEEDEAYMCDVIAFLEDARDCRQNALDCINWVKSIKERIGGKL